jgi:hypothetical protein
MKMQSLKCFRNAAWIERFTDCMCSRWRYVRKRVTADVIINIRDRRRRYGVQGDEMSR